MSDERSSLGDAGLKPYQRLIDAKRRIWSEPHAAEVPAWIESAVQCICALVAPLVPVLVREYVNYPGRGANGNGLDRWATALRDSSEWLASPGYRLAPDVSAPDRIERARPI